MAKTVAQIRDQIAKLQHQEQALLSKEVEGVVKRMQDAIAYYGLTPDQLFRSKPGRQKGKGRAPGRPASDRAKAGRQASPASSNPATKRRKIPVKYRDDQGNTWTGRGSQPRWLRAALEGGGKIEDFLK